MSTYNEHLRSSVLKALQDLELDQKAADAKLDTAMFTLHYAQEASAIALEKLSEAQSELEFKNRVKQQAIISCDIANNQLSSAKQASQYVKNAVTDTSVCAANVQIASNAIAKLASTLGNIYAIVNASDFDSEIFTQAEQARNLIDSTAYEAELASQLAMTASMQISQVPASAVLDLSTETNRAMTAVSATLSSEYDLASDKTIAAGKNSDLVSAKEKIAEGEYGNAEVDRTSTAEAYQLTNAQLNLDLTAFPKKGEESTTVSVGFNFIKNPFAAAVDPGSSHFDGRVYPPAPLNLEPVNNYYLFIVKYCKRDTFSLAAAEGILQTAPDQFVSLDFSGHSLPHSKINPTISYRYDQSKPDSEISGLTLDIVCNKMPSNAGIYTLKDADGEEIQPGTQYVAFIMAVYTAKYKRTINDFSDFLSAASPRFCLSNILQALSNTIYINPLNVSKDKKEDGLVMPLDFFGNNPTKNQDETYWLGFNITEKADYKVNYRCLFLPAGKAKPEIFIQDGAGKLEEKIAALEAISEKYDPLIAETEAAILNVASQIEALENSIKTLSVKASEKTTPQLKGKKSLQKVDKDVLNQEKEKLKKLQADYHQYQASLADNIAAKQMALNSKAVSSESPGFIFNLTIAEQIPAGNYISAISYPIGTPDADSLTQYFCYATIGPDTTDIFGNLLVDGAAYHLFVLSIADVEEENQTMFVNALSEISMTSSNPFIYNTLKAC